MSLVRRRKCALLVFLSFLFLSTLSAQDVDKWGVKTNAIHDILLSPNLQVELYARENLVLSIGGSYGWWGFDWKRKNAFQHWNVNADINYYLKKDSSFTGHHLGLGTQTGQFDYKRKETAKRGHFATSGLQYGYTWKLSDHFYLDAGLGVGYIYSFYHKYAFTPENDCNCCIGHPTKHMFGLTNLNVSLVYRFKEGGKR